MLKHTKIGVIAAFLLSTSAVYAQDSNVEADWDTVVANVNGEEITIGHMVVARQTLPPEYLTLEDKLLFDSILENLVQQTVLAQSIGDDISRADKLVMENDARAFLAGSAVNTILAAPVSDDEVQAMYDVTYAQAEAEEEFNAAHILVETKEEADAIVTLLEEGGDFPVIAREKSTGPSGPNGGNLGWFTKGKMVPEFEAAVIELEDGSYSAPVETQFGWHVIHRIESRIQDAPTLEAVREQLVAELSKAKLTEAVDSLTTTADITHPEGEAFDPALLKELSETEE